MKKKTSMMAALLLSAALLTACGKNTTVAVVGEYKVPQVEVEYYYNNVKVYYNDEEKSKEAAYNQAMLTYKFISVGEKMGMSVTDEDLAQKKQEVINNYGSQRMYDAQLHKANFSEKNMETILRAVLYREQIVEYIDQNEPMTDEDYLQFFEKKYRRAKHVLISTQNLSDEEKAQKKQLAEEILQRAQSGEDFDSLVSQYSEDPGSASNPNGYVFTDKEMVASFEQAVDSIGIGEFTLAESDYGYHVIQRLALDETPELEQEFYSNVKDSVDILAEEEYVNAFVDRKMEEYGIQAEIKKQI